MNRQEKIRMEKYKKYLKTVPFMYKAAEEICQKDDVFERTASYVLAPGINAFVLWVLREAVKSGKRRLYFLARDGYFMYRTAKLYCENLGLPLECRYLSCSRYSIRIPVFQYDYEEALNYICKGGIDVNMEKIFNRAGLSEREQIEISELIGCPYRMSDIIPHADLEELKKQLRKCKKFETYVIQHSRKSMPALKGYMRQEGLLENVPAAIVDSGWVGSMQKVFNQLLMRMGKKEVLEGYYWGLYELPEGVRREDYHCYYFAPESDYHEKVYFSNCLFEGIFSAPRGMTLGYRKTEKGYEPIYGEIDNDKKKFMEKMDIYIFWYTRMLLGRIKNLSDIDERSVKKAVKNLFGLFMGHPTKREAEIYGSLSFSDDVLEYGGQQAAEVLSENELRANHVVNKILVMLGIKRSYIKESAWYEGSAVRCGKHVRYHLIQFRIYKYLLYIRQSITWRRNYGKRK